MMQDFQPLVGYESTHKINKTGCIKTLKRRGNLEEKILPLFIDRRGYVRVSLTKDNEQKHKTLHRLLAIQFIPNPNNLPQVNHKDGNKKNNNLSNLEWCNNSHNIKHAIKMGLIKSYRGMNARNRKLTKEQVLEIRELKGLYSQRELGKMYNVDHTTIGLIHRRVKWSHF